MASYLVVAHQTAASPELVGKLREIAASDAEAEFVLLVPATPPAHLLTWVEGAREEIARHRASEATMELRDAGLSVADALIGPADPLRAIREEHDRGKKSYALTIISTLPPGLSRWLKRDLANQVRSQLGLAVVQVVTRYAPEQKRERMPPVTTSPPAVPTTAVEHDLRTVAGWRGRQIYCLDGLLGEVREIIYDYVSSEPIWLGVPGQPLPFRILLIPIQSVIVEGTTLKVTLTHQRILGQPDVSIGEGIASLTEEEQLYAYFGLPFEIRDTRVLRRGQEIPGMEQNLQNIFGRQEAGPRYVGG